MRSKEAVISQSESKTSPNGSEVKERDRLDGIQLYEWVPFSTQTYGKTSYVEDVEQIFLLNNGYTIEDKSSLFNPKIPTAEESGLDLQSLLKVGDRLKQTQERNENVLIYGDSDFDGVASTYILYELLKNFGIENVKTVVRARDDYGYGFNDRAAEEFGGEYGLIFAIDCGITADRQVARAKEKGSDVIIVDHHTVQEEEYPKDAYAVLHTTETSAAGIAYLLTEFYAEEYGIEKGDVLGVAGPAVYADNMAMTRVSRPIVKAGIESIRKKVPDYISALLYNNPTYLPNFSDSTISFDISPIMNTPGRFGDPKIALKILRPKDPQERKHLAGEMKRMDNQRKAIGEEILYEIREEVKKGNIDPRFLMYIVDSNKYKVPPTFVDSLVTRTVNNPKVNRVVFLCKEHNSKEFDEPVMICQCRGPNGTVNLIPFIALGKENGLIRGGGHPGAVGSTHFSSQHETIKNVATNYFEEAIPTLPPATQNIYCEIPPDRNVISNINEVQKGYVPFSFELEKPTLMARDFEVSHIQIDANKNFEKSKHLKVTFQDRNGQEIQGIEFNAHEEHLQLKVGDRVDAVFKVGESTFKGETSLQLFLEDFRYATDEEIPEYVPPLPHRSEYKPFDLPESPIVIIPEEIKEQIPAVSIVGFDMDDTLIANNEVNMYRHLFFEAWAHTRDDYFREIYSITEVGSPEWEEAMKRIRQVSYEFYSNRDDLQISEIPPEERIHHNAYMHSRSIRTDEERGELYAKVLGYETAEEFWDFFHTSFNRGMKRRVDEFKVVTPGAVDFLNYITEELQLETFLISNSKSSDLLDTEELLRQEGFRGRFNRKLSARSMGHEKPDPHALRNIFLKKANEPHTVMYVGNTVGDVDFTYNLHDFTTYPSDHPQIFDNISVLPVIINQGISYEDLNMSKLHAQFDSLATALSVIKRYR